MKRPLLIVALLVGVALALSVVGGAVWYFLWKQNDAGTTATGVEHQPRRATAEARREGGNNNARATKFEELDLDKDGQLSPTEFAGARKPAEAEKWFKLRDAN